MSEKISEESVPVQEVKSSATVSIRRFFRTLMIGVLSLLCIVGGILLYQLSLEDFGAVTVPQKRPQMMRRVVQEKPKTIPLTETAVPHQETSPVFAVMPKVVTNITPAPFVTQPMGDIPLPEPVSAAVEEKTADGKAEIGPTEPVSLSKPMVVEKNDAEEPAETVSETAPVLNDSELLPVIEPKSDLVAVEPSPAPAENHVALSKALRLRDQLQTGRSCLDSLQILLKNRLPDESQRELLTERLMPICTGTSAFQELEGLFTKNKKEALITYYRNTNNNRFVAYLKAMMTTLVDVRRLNPVKRKPKDIISLAQNALNAHDVAQAVAYIQELPAEILADFGEFNGLARAYLLAQEAADELILSFEKKGR